MTAKELISMLSDADPEAPVYFAGGQEIEARHIDLDHDTPRGRTVVICAQPSEGQANGFEQ